MKLAPPTRRSVLAAGAALAGAVALPKAPAADPRPVLNDASRLSPTPVFKHIVRGSDPTDSVIASLRAELQDAAVAKRPVTASAARHSMGGQSLARDGVAITLEGGVASLDMQGRTYRVAAGARWSDVIRTLDRAGFSPAVMQSNHDFGVASTFSVNAHGWPVPYGPFGSTVRSLRLMLADGTLVTCSPTENSDLFGLAMGGYGLFGIIVDLEVEMTDNLLLDPTVETMPAEAFADRFIAAATGDPNVKMAYGRLSIERAAFFREAVLTTYRPDPHPPTSLPPATSRNALTGVSRDLYRSQIGYESLKRVRWFAETRFAPTVTSGVATRNTLMNEPVANLYNSDPGRTDILHEYFVSPDRFVDFLHACRDIIPKARAEFLNVTLRYVAADRTSVLAYAPVPRIAAVMSFSQEVSPEGEVDMLQTTEALIDRIVAIGGAFYLPYRLHARRDQVEKAYPRVSDFVARKRQYDPGLLFQNTMWNTYFA
jgi:FAD/FMN-containing dehydrogenase